MENVVRTLLVVFPALAVAGCASAPVVPTAPTRTRLAVAGPQILLDDQPTTLLGFRVGSAQLRDDWTNELLAQLEPWRKQGVNALILWLQGTSGGFHPVFSPQGDAFGRERAPIVARAGWGLREVKAPNGSTTGQEVLARTRRIVEAADHHGMAVIVGVTYRHAVGENDTREKVARAMHTAGIALGAHENVMFAIWNEADITRPLETPESHQTYARALKAAAPGRPVCAGSLRAEMNAPLATLSEIDAVCQDAGRDLASTLAAFEQLADVPKPVINVESFGGSGGGYVDAPEAARGLEIATPGKSPWRRIFGAWEEADYQDGTGRRLMGRRSYRTLIERVAGHPERRWHVMVHAAGWFQGASRVGTPEQLGPVGEPGRWNNTFRLGFERGEGTVDDPGIGWILSSFARATTGEVVVDEALQGTTVGEQVGGQLTPDGYRPAMTSSIGHR